MSLTAQALESCDGEQPTIVLTMNPLTDMSAWLMTVTYRDETDAIITTKTVGAGITIDGNVIGVARCALGTALNGLSGKKLKWDWFRTNLTPARLAFGDHFVSSKVKA